MRSKHKEWKNGRYQPLWTVRIIWYQGPDENDIRLQMEDCERKTNVYPKTKEDADSLWDLFKQEAPETGVSTPFVSGLLDLARSFCI